MSMIVLDSKALESVNISLNPVVVYLAAKTPASKRSLVGALRFAFGTIGLDYMELRTWQALDYSTLSALRSQLLETGKAPSTINHALFAIRGVLKVAKRLELISQAKLESALAVEPIKSSSSVLAGREIQIQEAARLAEVIASDRTPAGVRDRALLAVLWGAGLRRAELAALQRSSLELESARLVVHGKGRKAREVYLSSGALEALKAWLALRGDSSGALFGAVSKSGRISLKHMSSQAVYNALSKRQEQAQLKRFTPHDLRRTYASALLGAGVDVATVAELLGHSSVNTTMRYDRRNSERKRKASSLLPSPF